MAEQKAQSKVDKKSIVDAEALLEQAYLHGKEYGLAVGESEGVKLVAQTAEQFIKEHKADRPTWWIATLVQCLKSKYLEATEKIGEIKDGSEAR